MTRRRHLVLVVVAALAAAGCDDGAPTPRSAAGGVAGRVPAEGGRSDDEWGEDVPPPTRDEILAAPAGHSVDALAQALVEVAESEDAAALPCVLALAADPREEIRWHAVLALKAIGGERAAAVIARIAADDESDLVREEAAR